MACCGPAYFSTQHWFLLVVVLGFLGTLFFSLYYLCLDVYLKGFNINWLQSVTIVNNDINRSLVHLPESRWLKIGKNMTKNFSQWWTLFFELDQNPWHRQTLNLPPKNMLVRSAWTAPPTQARKLTLAETHAQPCFAPLQEKNIRHGG